LVLPSSTISVPNVTIPAAFISNSMNDNAPLLITTILCWQSALTQREQLSEQPANTGSPKDRYATTAVIFRARWSFPISAAIASLGVKADEAAGCRRQPAQEGASAVGCHTR